MIVVVEQDAEIHVRERFGDIRLILALHLGWGHVFAHLVDARTRRWSLENIGNRFFFSTSFYVHAMPDRGKPDHDTFETWFVAKKYPFYVRGD